MARTRLFATSLSLVLKSLIRSAVLTASPHPLAVIFSSYAGFAVAVSFQDCLCYQVGRQSDFQLHPLLSLLFMSGTLSLWVFGIACDFRIGRQSGIHPLPLLSLFFMLSALSLWFFGIASGFRLITQNGIQPYPLLSRFQVTKIVAVNFRN